MYININVKNGESSKGQRIYFIQFDFFKLGIGGKPWLYMKKYTKIMPKNVNTIRIH